MPRDSNDLKRLTRRRMRERHESYTTARKRILESRGWDEDCGAAAGSLLREIRLARGLTLAECAARVGAARLRLDLVERGAARLPVDLAGLLIRELDVERDPARLILAAATAQERLESEADRGWADLVGIGGFRLSRPDGTLLHPWQEWFATGRNASLYVAEHVRDAPWLSAIVPDTPVVLSAPNVRIAAAARLTNGAKRDQALATLTARFPADADWLVYAVVLSITRQRSPISATAGGDGP